MTQAPAHGDGDRLAEDGRKSREAGELEPLGEESLDPVMRECPL
jgi:hypothetical protein